MPETELSTGKFTVQRLPPLVEVASAPVTTVEEQPPPTGCANCGQPLVGPYCAHCGQHIADYHRSVWRFVLDFFDNTFCWDNKLLRTLKPLFHQPGFLTGEFIRGRRVSYVHPLRLFLFTSAVCLALLKYGHDADRSSAHAVNAHRPRKGVYFQIGDVAIPLPDPDPIPAGSSPTAAAPRDVAPAKPADQKVAAKSATDAEDDDDPVDSTTSQTVADKLRTENKGGEAKLNAAAEKLKKASSEIEGASRQMTRNADRFAAEKAEHLSWVALALLPLFALGLRALFRRADRFYFEHLIFSLHYHVFLLLFWTSYVTVLAIASYLPLHGFFEFVVRLSLLLPPIYLYVALRRVYGEGKGRTVTKTLLLGATHLVAIIVGVAIGAPSIL